MRLRLPLYGKILTWFFLNLVIVAAVVATLFTLQFHFNLDWIFAATGAQDRWEAVLNLIIDELDTTRPDDWPQVLERYSEAYHVRFALFDEEARPLVGEIPELPPEVQTRVLERPVPSDFSRFHAPRHPLAHHPRPNAPQPHPKWEDQCDSRDEWDEWDEWDRQSPNPHRNHRHIALRGGG